MDIIRILHLFHLKLPNYLNFCELHEFVEYILYVSDEKKIAIVFTFFYRATRQLTIDFLEKNFLKSRINKVSQTNKCIDIFLAGVYFIMPIVGGIIYPILPGSGPTGDLMRFFFENFVIYSNFKTWI